MIQQLIGILYLLMIIPNLTKLGTDNMESSDIIVCVFYIEEESEIIEDICVEIQPSNENYCSDSEGLILIKDFNPGYYNLLCYYYNTITMIDSIYLKGPIAKIRLYDYLNETDKEYVDQANKDIEQGHIQILVPGLILSSDGYNEKINLLTKKYGFRYEYIGCVSLNEELYNKKMYLYLDKINGKGWRKKFRKEYNEIIK